VLKDQELPFCGLEEDLIGVVSFEGSGDWLTSLNQTDNNLLASELGDELRWCLSLCTLCFFDICLLIYFVGCHVSHIIILSPELPPILCFGLILECGTLVKRVRIINIDS
jgi:hypothetical protein